MTQVTFIVTFENDFESDDDVRRHVFQTVHAIGTNVLVQILEPTIVAIDRDRLARMRKAAEQVVE